MDIFGRFKQVLKIRDTLVDNNVFQLHYRVTALLLLSCAALVASKQHFGDPIDCITKDDVPNKIMDTYCWIHATFTLPAACNKTVGVEVAHPCVDKFSHNGEERVYHKYYQWVYFVLFFQAAFFYAPHFFWKTCEAKLLSRLTDELKDPLYDEENKAHFGKASRVASYLYRHRHLHQRYYRMFALFELTNLINVMIQVYIVDEFLGGAFTSYGLDVLRYAQLEQDERIDPMVKIFPRMTKCTFHRFGSSGDVQTYDALCILPLNIINEKIYIIMWFWFVVLAFITALWLTYRAATFLRGDLRLAVLKRRASFANEYHLERVLEHSKTGDWFLLCMMCKNMEAQWFALVIEKYYKKLARSQQRLSLSSGANKFSRAGRSQRNGRDAGRQPMLEAAEEQAVDELRRPPPPLAPDVDLEAGDDSSLDYDARAHSPPARGEPSDTMALAPRAEKA